VFMRAQVGEGVAKCLFRVGGPNWGFPGGSGVKKTHLPMQETQVGSLRGGNGNPLQYSCLGNPMDRGAWQATVHGVAKSQT